MTALFCVHSRKIVVSCNRVKNRKILCYNSVDAFALAEVIGKNGIHQ